MACLNISTTINTYSLETDKYVFAIAQNRRPLSLAERRRRRSRRRRSDRARETLFNASILVFPESDSPVPSMDESDMVPRYDQLSPVRTHRSPRLSQGLECLVDDVGVESTLNDLLISITSVDLAEEGLGGAPGTFQPQSVSSPRHVMSEYRQELMEPMEGMEYHSFHTNPAVSQGSMPLDMYDISLPSLNMSQEALRRADNLLSFPLMPDDYEDVLHNFTSFLGTVLAVDKFYEQCKQLEDFGRCLGIDSFEYSNSSDLQVVTGTRNDLKMLSMLLLKLAQPSIVFNQLVQYVAAAYNQLIFEWEGQHTNIDAADYFQTEFSEQSLRKSARSMYKTVGSWSPTFKDCKFRTFTELRGSVSPQAALIGPGVALFAYQRHEEHKRRAEGEPIKVSLLEAVRPDKVAERAFRMATLAH